MRASGGGQFSSRTPWNVHSKEVPRPQHEIEEGEQPIRAGPREAEDHGAAVATQAGVPLEKQWKPYRDEGERDQDTGSGRPAQADTNDLHGGVCRCYVEVRGEDGEVSALVSEDQGPRNRNG